jgi:hypothetical protein
MYKIRWTLDELTPPMHTVGTALSSKTSKISRIPLGPMMPFVSFLLAFVSQRFGGIMVTYIRRCRIY